MKTQRPATDRPSAQLCFECMKTEVGYDEEQANDTSSSFSLYCLFCFLFVGFSLIIFSTKYLMPQKYISPSSFSFLTSALFS